MREIYVFTVGIQGEKGGNMQILRLTAKQQAEETGSVEREGTIIGIPLDPHLVYLQPALGFQAQSVPCPLHIQTISGRRAEGRRQIWHFHLKELKATKWTV